MSSAVLVPSQAVPIILPMTNYYEMTLIIIKSNPNSQAVKKECGPDKGYGEKRCEIQGGGQEMAVMVG